MNISVLAKLVPDLVEELTIDSNGKSLDVTWLRLKLNEFDDHAIEQAILLKERFGAQVTLMVPDQESADDVLFSASAKGCDRLVKLTGSSDLDMNNHDLAQAFLKALEHFPADLILTGVQAHNDLDGSLGALLAGLTGLPYVGYVSGVNLQDGSALVQKEYPGGLIAEMSVELPAVLGIQAAERPPSYVAFSKIRQAMKTATIDELSMKEMGSRAQLEINRMFQPESGTKATMLEGDMEQVASKLVELFHESGLV